MASDQGTKNYNTTTTSTAQGGTIMPKIALVDDHFIVRQGLEFFTFDTTTDRSCRKLWGRSSTIRCFSNRSNRTRTYPC